MKRFYLFILFVFFWGGFKGIRFKVRVYADGGALELGGIIGFL